MRRLLNALTIDVEDWYQGIEIEPHEWDHYESRIEQSLPHLLDILANNEVKATFFVLGWLARQKPDLVRAIADAGHEIGTHGDSHRLLYKQGQKAFAEDLARSIDILEEVTGRPVKAHRAPFFSITKESLWAFDVLLEQGITLDSSVFPIHNYRYGIPDAPRKPYRYAKNGQQLTEFPISTTRMLGKNLPFAGGFYLRFLPYFFISRALASLNRDNIPVVIYLHPWELDPEHPRLDLPRRIAWPHYHNLKGTEAKLRSLLASFDFAPLGKIAAQLQL